ncbi:glycosyltransferase family 2 protein [Candidatus Parcubacteria bacterium]|nr:glycosyltransferase family 2 protein [Candidatus Parcubacteria bacterium]
MNHEIKKNNKVYAVIPAYNEENNIISTINNIKKYISNIIVIDDGSEDDTYALLKQNFNNQITILKHKINLGKGAAIKTGCEAAIKMGAKTLVMIDGDGQHMGEDIPKLIHKLEKEKLDIIFGLRTFSKKMPLLMRAGNKFLSFIINLVSKIKLEDTQSGFRIFTADAYKKIHWVSTDYSVETEMIIRAGKHNLKYGTVPIQTIYKDNHKGTTPIDGIIIFFNLLKWRFL